MKSSLNIPSIYYTIGDKGKFIGLPIIYIRFSECNLTCYNCPVKEVKEKGKRLTFNEIEYIIKKAPTKYIELTGGEPLLQKDIVKFIEFLKEQNYTIILKTNGSMPISHIPKYVIKIIDCKTPSTGENNSFEYSVIKDISQNDIIRFIISEERDYIWMKTIANEYNLFQKCEILASIDEDKIQKELVIKWCLKDKLSVRIATFYPKLPKVELYKA